ncbi:MAG TPA: carboxypeptidase-like regulatory domain-containing protein, partial [Pyrinomonadaceae bacterium]|nr:carboxypeptidase-like regulatory domain-containing protein [Pyrinomonadaceae bacterium]
MNFPKRISLLLLPVLLSIPLLVTHAAGGTIEGKIIDPKGGAIPAATVTVTNQATKQDFTAVTDAQGRYKVEGLPAGSYTVRVSAKGFNEARREEVKVNDNSTASIDLRLEIAPVEAQVKVSAATQKGNQDPVYQALRQLGRTDQDFAGSYAVVNNLILKRDAASFTLKSGELYFITPVENRVTAAVFIGDGELSLTPPTEVEKNSLKIFTGDGSIKEQFTHLVLRFTDKTFDEIKASPNATMKTGGPSASQARGLYHDNQDLLRKRLRENRELRTLFDLYSPNREGCFTAFIDGKRFNKLVFVLEPLGVPTAMPEEVALLSYGE